MKHKRWCFELISGLSILWLSAALPVRQSEITSKDADRVDWGHVNKTCIGADCVDEINYKQLELLTSHMNLKANPCEDFHEYACGNWNKVHPGGITTMQVANDQLTLQYVELFEQWVQEVKTTEISLHRGIREPELQRYAYVVREKKNAEEKASWLSQANSDWDYKNDVVLKKMLKYYDVCKASGLETKHKFRDYIDVVRSKIIRPQSDFNWLETLALLGRYGYNRHFLAVEVTRFNSTAYHTKIFAPFENEQAALTDEVYEVLRDFTDKSQLELKAQFETLEGDLKTIKCEDCEALRNATPNKRLEDDDENDLCGCYDDEVMTFGVLQQRIPEVDWQQFLSLQLRRTMRPSDLLTVVDLNFIKKQLHYINNLDKELSRLYTIARFLQFLTEQPHSLIKNKVNEANCMRQMRKIFYMPMNYIYERAVYSKYRHESESIILGIFQKLKTEFSKRLLANRMQLSDDILAELQTKLDVMSINVGNLPPAVDLDFFYGYANQLNLTSNYYKNYLHALEVFYIQHNQLPDLSSESIDASHFNSFNLHSPSFPDNLDSSPYYHCLRNAIVIPYAYLRPPFYDHRLWAGFIYGDLASSLGHELMHAFDTTFLAYDAFGNLSDLLARIKRNSHFQENVNCLINGTKFLEERIADISGSRLALNAFMNWDPNALKYNGKLYFLQFSQFFCGAAEPSVFEAQDANHDMDRIRLNYTPKQIPEFAEIFQCPVGSPMHLDKVCELW